MAVGAVTTIDPTPWIPEHMAAHDGDRDADLLANFECYGSYWTIEHPASTLRPGDHLWMPRFGLAGHEFVITKVVVTADRHVTVEAAMAIGEPLPDRRWKFRWAAADLVETVPDPKEVIL